ncbi:MAG: amidohydrolase family protein [Actinomycetales bacterium]
MTIATGSGGSVLLRGLDHVLTCDEDDTVRHGVDVLVVDGVITEIGPSLQAPPGVVTRDGSGRLLLPGLINLHTHTPMTLLRGIAEGVNLAGFLEKVWAAEARLMNPETVETGARLAGWESLAAGVTTTLDMYLFPGAAHRGAAATGLRHIAGPVFFDGPGPDGLTWPQRLTEAAGWRAELAEVGGPYVPFTLMPHGTYTNSPEHLSELAALAADTAADLITVHASETTAENVDVLTRFGATPVGLLAAAGLLQTRTVLGHGVHLDEHDLNTVLAHDTAIAHCPGSNLKLASGALNWEELRARGVRLGLGTDGCSSSNDLDLWQVMRQAALLARLTAADPTAGQATAVLRAATIEGARALGLADLIGSVEVGKRADLTLLDLNAPHLVPIHDLPALLVFAAGRSDVVDVLVDGHLVLADRRSTRLDEAELLAEVRALGAQT